jgi:hypothetical protein
MFILSNERGRHFLIGSTERPNHTFFFHFRRDVTKEKCFAYIAKFSLPIWHNKISCENPLHNTLTQSKFKTITVLQLGKVFVIYCFWQFL